MITGVEYREKELDGVGVLKKLRQEDDRIPIIMLTARNVILDKAHSLDLGADDYLAFGTRPGSFEVCGRREGIEGLCPGGQY